MIIGSCLYEYQELKDNKEITGIIEENVMRYVIFYIQFTGLEEQDN